MSRVFAYIRVSSVQQNDERQDVIIEKYNCTEVFREKVSGKDLNRPEFQTLMRAAYKGDTIVIKDLSRISRNSRDLLKIVDDLNARGIKLISDKEGIDFSSKMSEPIIFMMGWLSEMERDAIRERQAEGIKIAVEKGAFKKEVITWQKFTTFEFFYGKWLNRDITKRKWSQEMGVSRPVLDRLIKEYKESLTNEV